MSKYKTLIFDLDDTLIDNKQSIKYAFNVILKELRIEYSDELFLKWKKFDDSYWDTWENGTMILPITFNSLESKITYLKAKRFLIFFKNLNISFFEAIALNELYCSMLGVNIVEIKGARNLLKDFYNKSEILIATNGPKEAADNKLEKANLNAYISKVICSEDIGFSKPMKEFFDYLYGESQNKDKEKMLLIGDSLTTDVLGGMNYGIDTCWFNPNNNQLLEGYYPTMTINKLMQLKKKL